MQWYCFFYSQTDNFFEYNKDVCSFSVGVCKFCHYSAEERDRLNSLTGRCLWPRLSSSHWILVSVPAQLAARWDLQLFSQQLLAAQLFPAITKLLCGLIDMAVQLIHAAGLKYLLQCHCADNVVQSWRHGANIYVSCYLFHLLCSLKSIWLSIILFYSSVF